MIDNVTLGRAITNPNGLLTHEGSLSGTVVGWMSDQVANESSFEPQTICLQAVDTNSDMVKFFRDWQQKVADSIQTREDYLSKPIEPIEGPPYPRALWESIRNYLRAHTFDVIFGHRRDFAWGWGRLHDENEPSTMKMRVLKKRSSLDPDLPFTVTFNMDDLRFRDGNHQSEKRDEPEPPL